MVLLLTATSAAPAPVVLPRQVIALPANAGEPLFVDIEGTGRSSMLVIDRAAKTLLNYLQRPDGFPAKPDQVIPLPPRQPGSPRLTWMRIRGLNS